MTSNASSSPRRGLNISFVQIAVVVGLILGISIILDFQQRIQAAQIIIAEVERLEFEVSKLQADQEGLQATLAYVESDAYVEDWSHSEGQLVRPGEVLVIPVKKPSALSAPEPLAPRPPAPPIINWQLWLELFFDNIQ